MHVSLALSWLALCVEAAVASAHWTKSRDWYRMRHNALTAFVVSTYFLMPVPGFAWILVILGLAQCDDGDRPRIVRYLFLLAGMELVILPWRSLLARAAGLF